MKSVSYNDGAINFPFWIFPFLYRDALVYLVSDVHHSKNTLIGRVQENFLGCL